MRGKREAIDKLKELEGRGEPLYVPSPTLYELYVGIALSEMPETSKLTLRRRLRNLPTLPLNAKAARLAGLVQGSLMRRGIPVDPIDALIAGIALAHGEAVLTRNSDHFERIPKLKVETY